MTDHEEAHEAVYKAIGAIRDGDVPELDSVLVHPDIVAQARREADLAGLSAYVRTLADRMGLKDWTFGVEYVDDDDFAANITFDDITRTATLVVDESFFGLTPERRRVIVVRELIRCHFRDTKATDAGHVWAAVTRLARAWAPCLPLPLAGPLARLAAPAGGPDDDVRDAR
jgi:hypothetical protein